MERLIKTVELKNCELYGTVGESRYLLAKCKAEIEIYEESRNIPTLGKRGCNIRKRHFSIILCEDPGAGLNVDIEFLKNVGCFDLVGNVLRKDGIYERMIFNNIDPVDIDLDGDWRFDVPENTGITKKLLNM